MIFDDLIHFVSVIGKLTQPATTTVYSKFQTIQVGAMMSVVNSVVKCLLQTNRGDGHKSWDEDCLLSS